MWKGRAKSELFIIQRDTAFDIFHRDSIYIFQVSVKVSPTENWFAFEAKEFPNTLRKASEKKKAKNGKGEKKCLCFAKERKMKWKRGEEIW